MSVDEPAAPEQPGVPLDSTASVSSGRSSVDASSPAPDDAVLPADGAADLDEPAPTSPAFAYAGAFVAGFALGLVGAIVAASRVIVRGVTVPVGLVLVLLAVLAVARGMAWFSGSRRGAAFVALGWVLPTLGYLLLSPGGDVLLPDVARTTWYLLGSAVLLVGAMAFPLPRGVRELAEARRSGRVDPPDPA